MEDAIYSADAAKAAVDLLMETLDVIVTKPKPAVRDWAAGFRGQVDGLRQQRI